MSAVPTTRELSMAEWLRPDLAMDLAMRLRPTKDVAEKYGLTVSELQLLLNFPAFRQMVADAKSVWASDMNAEQRVRAKAALAVEDTIPDLHGIVVDNMADPRHRSDAFSKLARVAQLDAPPAAGGAGGQFSLVINMPGEGSKPATTITAPVVHLPPSDD